MGYSNLYGRAAARDGGQEEADRVRMIGQSSVWRCILSSFPNNPEEPESEQSNTLPSCCHLRGTQGSAATLVAFRLSAFLTHLPPPVGAAELIACTMSVVRASSKLVINSTFFPSGQPAERKEEV